MRHAALLGLFLLAACSGRNDARPERDAAADPPHGDAAAERPDGRVEQPGPGFPTAIDLPQAIHGAFFANPTVYESIPLRARVAGETDAVQLVVDGMTLEATPVGDEWVATLPMRGMTEGAHQVEAIAGEAHAQAELVIGSEGQQITSFGVDGLVTTPAVHREGNSLFLSYVEREGDRGLVLREIDGAARPLGEDIKIDLGTQAVIYAKVAITADRIAVLFQRSGRPFASYFRLLDRTGNPITDVVSLDPDGYGGMEGGDIAHDGKGFSVVYRAWGGPGPSRVMFARFDAQGGAMTGPLVVAEERDPDDGRFEPSSPVGVACGEGRSFVAFTRKAYDPILEFWVPKTEVAVVSHDGHVESSEPPARESGWGYFHWESYVFRSREGALALWVASELNESDESPPLEILANEISPSGERLAPTATTLVDAPDNRYEPYVSASPHHRWGVMLWGDARSYADDLLHGRIRLYAAPIGEDAAGIAPTEFEHARLFANVAHIRGAALGSNTIVVWLDDRRSVSVFDRHPEIYVDTVWE